MPLSRTLISPNVSLFSLVITSIFLSPSGRLLADSHYLLPSIAQIFSSQEKLEAGSWTVLHTILNDTELATLPLPITLADAGLTRIECSLDEPQSMADNPRRFTAGLAISLPIRATLKNTTKEHKISVKVSGST